MTPLNLFSAALLLARAGNVLAITHYVDVNSTNPTPPYANWTTAATNIQDAVDAAMAGDEIVVTNGIYATGAPNGNIVKVDKPSNVRSVNGPEITTIDAGGMNRCVYLTSSASLSGFTLTGGRTTHGAGVFCTDATAVISNCVLSANVATGGYSGRPANNYVSAVGGGAYGGALNNCILTGNSVEADGNDPVFYNNRGGGGAAYCTLNNCVLTGNRASGYYSSYTYRVPCGFDNWCCNTRVTDTPAAGGGAYHCILNNCTLTGNSAAYVYSISGALGCFGFPPPAPKGGAGADCTLHNCILYSNLPPVYNSSLDHCWLSDPLFAGYDEGNLRLQSNSPCINAGWNAFAPAGPDLDGNPRIVGGTVDIGAYEYQSLSLINLGVVSNRFGFNVTGQSNWTIVLEASTDFTNWTALTTNTLGGGPFPFSDPTSPNLPQRFYRARME